MALTSEDKQWIVDLLERRFGTQSGAEDTQVGDVFDFTGYALEYFASRGIADNEFGPLVRDALKSLPDALLYEKTGEEPSEAQTKLLDHNRALIEAEPRFFVTLMMGVAPIRECRDTNGSLIPGLMVLPTVNRRVNTKPTLTREEAESICRDFATTRVHMAHMRDQDQEVAATGFSVG